MATEKRERQRANRQLRHQEEAKQVRRDTTKRRAVIGALAVFGGLVIVLGLAALGGAFSGGDDDETTPTSAASLPSIPESSLPGGLAATPSTEAPATLPAGETPCPEADGSSPRVIAFGQAPPMCIDPDTTYTAEIVTNHGDLTIELDAAAAPTTVNNFVVLARYHYFDNTVCHRAISGFMVQCGDPTATGMGDPGYEFENENPSANTDYVRGALAMANAGPDTNGSQFFITTTDSSPSLETNYSLFGRVVDGLDTTLPALDALGANPTAQNGVPPSEQIVIESVTISEGAPATSGTSATTGGTSAASTPATTAAAPATTGG